MNKTLLWSYDTIVEINIATSMVKNRYNGQIMMKKLSAAECFTLYRKIQNIQEKHLMRIFDVQMNNNLCEILCEYVPGYTLDYLVEKNGPFKEKKAREIMVQLCEGLKALHDNGIIHKDIKPSNVIMAPDGTVKIIDFDISRTKKPNQTKDTAIFGTAGYASPEHFGFAQTDEKADIYSCGVLFNFLLTGKKPDELMYDGPAAYIIQQCIQIDKEKRFNNSNELKAAILGKYRPESRTYRPLPGFRKKNFLLNSFTAVMITFYLLGLFAYIHAIVTGDASMSSFTTSQKILDFMAIFLFFTLFPYILFGDIGLLSEKINPKNPRNGKYVLNALGIISIILGFLCLFLQIS